MDPRPRDNTDPAKDIARTLADIAHQIATFKGKANAYLTDPNYDTLRLSACSSVSFASTFALVPAYQAGVSLVSCCRDRPRVGQRRLRQRRWRFAP